jgi:hypothetical protein
VIGILFDPEDGGNMFLRNIGVLLNYTALYSKLQLLKKN